MNVNLSNFLVDLASQPSRIADFLADPRRVVDESSLTAEEKSAVLSGDGARIRTALGLAPGENPASVLDKSKKPSKRKPTPKPTKKKRPGGKSNKKK